MARYKKQDRKASSVEYLRFEHDKEKVISVSDWDFSKSATGYLFKCYVVKEDGNEVDKIWTVWDYTSAQKLKKKLGSKYVAGKKELKVVMRRDEEEDENYFDIL